MAKFISEYEKKVLLVADFVNHTDGKVEFVLVDNYKNTRTALYDGRQEYLACTEEGLADELCNKVVEDFDITKNGKIILFLAEEKL